MPKGRLAEPRLVRCRECAFPFLTDRVGRAAWHCERPECVQQRLEAKRERDRDRPRTRRASAPQAPPAPALDAGPLSEDLEVIVRLAQDIGASPRILRDTVVALAKGDGDMRFLYRRLAAVALALAAYVGGKRL